MLLAGLVGACLRLIALDNRPVHADEAVQAVRFIRLLEQGEYQYDPQEYHGPSLPYLTLLVARLAGIREGKALEAPHLRIVPAVMGILLVFGPWCVWRRLGRAPTLLAAWATAISPAMIFYSRYYIAEMLLVGFAWGTMIGLWGVRHWLEMSSGGETDCLANSEERGGQLSLATLLLLGICLGMMHATKETCVIPLASMVLGIVGTRRSLKGVSKAQMFISLAAVLLLAAGVSALFFSSFGRNPAGILDSFKTYGHYFQQAGGEGRGSQHVYPFYYYFRVLFAWKEPGGMWWSEAGVLVLALVGMTAGVLRRGLRPEQIPWVQFLGIYTLIQFVIYSAIPYKTPWCALGFYHGMLVLAGVGGVVLWQWAARRSGRSLEAPSGLRRGKKFRLEIASLWKQALLLVLFVVGSGHLIWQAYQASFVKLADPTQPYLYAPTTLEVDHLVARLERIAECDPAGEALPIQVFFPDHQYWPLPWYLRRFSRMGWFGQVADADGSPPAPVILAHPDCEPELLEYLYHRQAPGQRRLYRTGGGQEPWEWEIRPYVPIRVYLRWDLWEACADTLSQEKAP